MAGGFRDFLRRALGWKDASIILSDEQKTLGGVPAVVLDIGGHTLSAFVRAYHYEEVSQERGYLSLWLDNRAGQFDDLATDYPDLDRGAIVELQRGLTIGNITSTEELPRMWVESFEYIEDGTLLITCIDWWGVLEGHRYAAETTWSASTHSTIAASILGAPGPTLTLAAGSFGYSVDFVASIFEDSDLSLQRLMDQANEVLYSGIDGEVLWQELDPAEASGYSYDFSAGGGAKHPLLPETEIAQNSARYNKVTVNGGTNLEFSDTATNLPEITLTGQTRLRTINNRGLSSNAECLEQATAELRQEQAEATATTLVARPHFTLKMYDVVDYEAPPWGGDAGTGRVLEFVEELDLDKMIWEQEITIGDLNVFALATHEETRRGRRRKRRRAKRRRRKRRSSGGSQSNTGGEDIPGATPIGGIIMWSGTVAGISDGWALCDGSSGTPDLRDRFIVGAGTTYTPGDTGGAATADIQHQHNDGTLAAANDTHKHNDGTLAAANDTHNHNDGTLAAASDSHSHTDGTLAASGPTSVRAVDINLDGATANVGDGTHGHDVTGATANDGHTHSVTGTTANDTHGHGVTGATANDTHGHDVTGATANALSATQDILPPYYALAFIMRIS